MLQGHASEGALKALRGLRGGVVIIGGIGMLCVLPSAVILPQNVDTAQSLGHPIAKPVLIALCKMQGFSIQYSLFLEGKNNKCFHLLDLLAGDSNAGNL